MIYSKQAFDLNRAEAILPRREQVPALRSDTIRRARRNVCGVVHCAVHFGAKPVDADAGFLAKCICARTGASGIGIGIGIGTCHDESPRS